MYLLFIVYLLFFRWKKMEHHDVMAECDRFTLDKYREVFRTANSRSTPPLGLQVLLKYICIIINIYK